jgi:hypothetical protein
LTGTEINSTIQLKGTETIRTTRAKGEVKMKKVFKKIDKCSVELLRELSKQKNVFFRFHDPKRRLSSRSKSWGMVFESEREALSCGSTVLNGKSCVKDAEKLMEWKRSFDNSYVVVAFEGQDTKEEGHDGEMVATYYKKVKCFSYEDFINCFEYKGYVGEKIKKYVGYVYRDAA